MMCPSERMTLDMSFALALFSLLSIWSPIVV